MGVVEQLASSYQRGDIHPSDRVGRGGGEADLNFIVLSAVVLRQELYTVSLIRVLW